MGAQDTTLSKRRRRKKRPPAIDRGTPEQQARRRALIGAAAAHLAEYPLGVLLARGLVTAEQHDAGCHYAYLAGRVLGRTKPYRAEAAGGGGAELTEAARASIERRWLEAVRLLLGAGRRAKDAVDNAAIFERLPGWLAREQPRPNDTAEQQALVAGLDVLARWRAGQLRSVVLPDAAE